MGQCTSALSKNKNDKRNKSYLRNPKYFVNVAEQQKWFLNTIPIPNIIELIGDYLCFAVVEWANYSQQDDMSSPNILVYPQQRDISSPNILVTSSRPDQLLTTVVIKKVFNKKHYHVYGLYPINKYSTVDVANFGVQLHHFDPLHMGDYNYCLFLGLGTIDNHYGLIVTKGGFCICLYAEDRFNGTSPILLPQDGPTPIQNIKRVGISVNLTKNTLTFYINDKILCTTITTRHNERSHADKDISDGQPMIWQISKKEKLQNTHLSLFITNVKQCEIEMIEGWKPPKPYLLNDGTTIYSLVSK